MESSFKFQISQTVKVLLYKIKMGHGKRWTLSGDPDQAEGILYLFHDDDPRNITTIEFHPGEMEILTACSKHKYVIKDLPDSKALVTFYGPVNGLLAQSLMPRMTYLPETLVARSEDMPDGQYVPIGEYMKRRQQRNAGNPNPQDAKGYRVNARFNNELAPYLPEAHGLTRSKRKRR